MTSQPDITFERWHVVPAEGHVSGKDKERAFVCVDFMNIKQHVFGIDDCLLARTLGQDCQSWLLQRMGMANSTFGQMFVPILSPGQSATTMKQTEQVLSEISTRGLVLLTDAERNRLLEALNRLRIGNVKMLLSERSLSLTGNTANLIDRLITSYEHLVSTLDHSDRTFARFFSKWILQPKGTASWKAMEIGYL